MSDLTTFLAKMSALLFYARVLTTQIRWFRYGLWLTQTLNFLWYLSSIARCFLSCVPVDKYWRPGKAGSCRDPNALYLGNVIPAVIIDLLILLLPLPIISRLSMKKSRKVLITGVFICGYL